MSNNNNNNIELLAKVDHLAKITQEKKNKAINTTKLFAIVYGILVLFVFAYTSIIFAKIKEYTTPDAVSAIVKNRIKESLPDLNKGLLDMTKKNAPILAEKAVEAVQEAIPKVEDMIKEMIDQNAKLLIVQIKTELFPQFLKIIRENAKPISESADALTDENTAKEIAKVLAQEIEREIDYNVIGDEFYKKLDAFRAELEKIVLKPANQLTAKEAAERRIIVNWIYLVKKGESVQSIMTSLVYRFSFIWEDLIGSVIPDDSVKDDTIAED
ncbi:MAG TPA: hypothetical protein DET40_08710 [Lentisphaeria bacterium]|nr:MAG: hypothetical protein A2X45_19385 [Lentisphaerae bacterium GWF2_50_93]HCE43616.1 hypothetical protein [Lentisphaeria bacterium]